MIDPQLGGKVVLITGGNHGIGAAAAKACAAQGCDAPVIQAGTFEELCYVDQ